MKPTDPRYPCACCGHLTFEEPPGSYEICSVCGWEDDLVQLRWPDWSGGANGPSLVDAQREHAERGASEAVLTDRVPRTAPLDPRWRPVDLTTDRFEPRGLSEAPWPADRTSLYWWRPNYWRLPADARERHPGPSGA